MKITIEGSPKELAELAKVLNGSETAAEKKADIPLLLTELADNNAIVRNAKVKPIERTFASFKPMFEATLKKFYGRDKVDELAEAIQNAGKENAPQAETAEQNTNKEIFEKQMKLLSQASKDCLSEISLYQHLPALTQAMIELHQCTC